MADKLEEAVRRMKLLKLHHNTIEDLVKHNIINKSEQRGILYWLEGEEEEIIREWEKETGNLAYHVIYNNTEFGRLLNVLYVSKYQDDWVLDRRDIEEGNVLAYVKNLDDDYCSEYGSIGIKPSIGGLIRTY